MVGLTTIKKIVPKSFRPAFKKAFYSARSIYFSGSEVHCPFCNGRFRQMLPFGKKYDILKEKEVIGGGYRENCLCPKCNSSDRERLVYLFLKYRTNLLTRETSVLHIAPEINLTGIFKNKKNFNYLSGDLNSPLAMMKMDVTALPLENCLYDLIICNHVLEHVPEDRKAMSEFFRVLKPGGIAILQVPVSRKMNTTIEDLNIKTEIEKINHFGQKDHVRIYSAEDYIDRLTKSGFIVQEFNWTKFREFHPKNNKYSLNPAEYLFIAKKPL